MYKRKREYSAAKIIDYIKTKRESYWLKQREKNALALFQTAARRVPAYKDFLAQNKIKPEKVTSWKDFQFVPQTDKDNYLKQYPLDSLCWDGELYKPLIFTSTSGSTGEPFYFVRMSQIDWQLSVYLQEFLERRPNMEKEGPILVINCFGMGVWIGGLITYRGFEIVAQRNSYPISLIAPGFNKREIFKTLRNVAHKFNTVILAGYPPFIKDIIDEASDQGIDLERLNIRIKFAAEAITEEFRDYIINKAGVRNGYLDIINVYGSADLGAMAVEGPTSILIRRLAKDNRRIFYNLFSPIDKTPTLAQYNPHFITFEAPDGEILLTGNSAMPLIRYSIGDNGGVFSYSEVSRKLRSEGLNLEEEAKKEDIQGNLSRLPFVYVYERVDLSTSFYGLWIYPEWIRIALLKEPLAEFLTGKFTMMTKYDKNQNQYIEVNIELKKGKKVDEFLEKQTLEIIVSTLRDVSSEYNEIYNDLKERALPMLNFWPAEHPLHFMPGIKQEWVKKA